MLCFTIRSDAFICILVGVFSMASGYLVVLIYEYAASNDLTKAERAHATNILNIGFQVKILFHHVSLFGE